MPDPRIRRIVEKLLAEAKIKEPPAAISMQKIAKVLGVTVRHGPMPDELSGFLLREPSGAVIGLNSLHPKTRQAFTFAHECGHFLLHPTGSFIDRGFIYFRDASSSQGRDRREIEANEFAAMFLMPEPFVQKALKGKRIDLEDEDRIQEVARVFGVSSQALTFRLINLRLAQP
jgi:Zn-dependent peptidase ImmA (M78 family)